MTTTASHRHWGSVVGVFVLGFLAACTNSDCRSPSVQNGDGAIANVERQLGIDLPRGAQVLHEGGSGREGESYYEWVIYSPTPIEMPKMKLSGRPGYLELPVLDSVALVESRISATLPEAQAALASDWTHAGRAYDATLVRTCEGDYMIVMSFAQE